MADLAGLRASAFNLQILAAGREDYELAELFVLPYSFRTIEMRRHCKKLEEGDSNVAEIDWLLEAKTAYERGNATAATAAALIDIANTLRIQKGSD